MEPQKVKSTMIPVFIFVIKLNRMLVKQKVIGVFEKKCKIMCAKQESVSDATFKSWPFLSDFNFASKHDGVNTTTYFQLVVGPTVTNCCKELHLKYNKITRFVFEKSCMHER